MMKEVIIEKCEDYSLNKINSVLSKFEKLFLDNIHKGDSVVIKPNWIAPHHRYRHEEWECVITHPNVIAAVIKQCVRYLKNEGKIIIADAPQTDSSFKNIIELMNIHEWKRLCESNNIQLQILDLRDNEWCEDHDGIIHNRIKLPGDPLGSVEYNLRHFSEFINHKTSIKGYYGADYDTKETNHAHTNGNHLYRLSRSIIQADVFINLPKLKTHKKAGITCSLKNLVGINTYKNYLPHFSSGIPLMNGDQFPNNSVKNLIEVYLLDYFKKILLKCDRYATRFSPVKNYGKKIFGETKSTIRSGNWYGNNTLWRTILDINKLLFYGNPNGSMRKDSLLEQKRYISIIDGIISGEGDGPEAPDPLRTGVILGGCNPVSVDCLASKLMGFDYTKIPTLKNAFEIKDYPIATYSYDDIDVISDSITQYNCKLSLIKKQNCFSFKPHLGWKGFIEL